MSRIPKTVRVSKSDVGEKLSSKKDLFHLLSYQCLFASNFLGKFYLPSIGKCTLKYLDEVSKGDKKVLKISEVDPVEVPNFDELGPAKIYHKILDY